MDREKMLVEWNKLLQEHPTFARAFLVQQAILMEASELGYAFVDRSMCHLLDSGLPVLFEDFWAERCKTKVRAEIAIGGLVGCLTTGNRDPANCFDLDGPEGFFDDPLAGGRTLPPKPPIPPL
jgi:hypothetical protein